MSGPAHEPPSHPHDEPPVTAAGDEELLAAVADEFAARVRRRERPRVEEYVAKHPALADRIRNVLPAIALIEETRSVDSTPAGERPGGTIGRYKLLERVGEGGFGVVYMAEQVTPVRRKVALKVLKPGMDSRQVLARFDAERQALAIMDHPNIARVFDAGATDAGRPYFVMELVRGVPITEFCDQQQLNPRQRLELFGQVCHAVQHAHQKGIIHRDIKPSNVLVMRHDTEPVVKVIDFGIAKALGQELTDKTLFTGFAQLLGTPLYMSPEQAGQSAIDIDTRSDIYSLGVLLYELLTGTTPFDKERFRTAAQDEMRRIIREEEPPRPSTRLSDSKEPLASISAQRHTEPAKLTKLVRGELDWIVMKALEKDRTRRYETVTGLARDVERYLNDETVQACPPSARYRLRKLTRKYRVPLTVAAGFLLLLVAAAVVSTYQAIRIGAEQQKTLVQKGEAERERERAVAAEQTALTEARKSEQVAAFMTDMLEGVGPSVALGRDTTMLREILDNTTKRLDELRGQPAVEADLRTVLGDVYYDLGDYPRAEAMFRAALGLRGELLGNKHVDVAKSLTDLGEALRKQKRSVEAEQLLAEGLAIQRELLGNGDPAVGLTLFRLGMMYNLMGRGAEAEARFRDALVIFRQHTDPNLPSALDQLGLSLTYQAKHSQAEPFARECLALRRKQAPSGNPDVAHALHNLGFLLREGGRLAEAEPIFREALEIRLKQLGELHPDVGVTRIIYAESLRRQGKYGEAEAMAEEALATARRRSGQHHATTVSPLYVLGRTLHDQGRLAEAETHLRAALAIAEKLFPDDWSTHSSRIALAAVLVAQERYREAEPLLLSSFKAVKLREGGIPSWGRLALKEAAHSLLRLYDVTGQTEKLPQWREELRELERLNARPLTTTQPANSSAAETQPIPH